MFSLMKKRNEAARQKKMDHIFAKGDDNGNGKITPQQMVKLFAANDVTGNSILSISVTSEHFQIKYYTNQKL